MCTFAGSSDFEVKEVVQRRLFRESSGFWIIVLPFVAFLVYWVLQVEKGAGFEALQIPHNPQLNLFFSIATFLGDGITHVVITLLLATFSNFRKAIVLAGGYLSSSALVQFLKHLVFHDAARPVKWFELNNLIIHVPDGLEPHHWNSFPSGHSAAAAVLFLFIALSTRNVAIQVLSALLLVLAAYSRVYLYVHFPSDLLAGLTIGLSCMMLCMRFLPPVLQKPWADRRFLKR